MVPSEMRREFAERGLLDLYQLQKKWLKLEWAGILEQEFAPRKASGLRQRRPVSGVKPFWFIGD